jgi:energy-converting hydrogenase Eha subunit C
MTGRRFLLYVALAVPPLILAGIGITHPQQLTMASAEYWRDLHVVTLPIFPLLGFAPWIVVRFAHNLWLSWAAGILGFVYAAFYTGLDVLAGIGAGGLKLDNMGMATGTVFGLGRGLGAIGAVAFIAAVLLAGIVAIIRFGVPTIPGAALVFIGSLCLYQDHIYFPVGVIGQLCLAAGWVLLVVAIRQRIDSAERTKHGAEASVTA